MSSLNFDKEIIDICPISFYIDPIHIIHDDYMNKNFEDISPRDITYLMHIFYFPNCSQRDLANLLLVSESNVTQFIKKLEKNKFITRNPDVKNKSRKILTLTEKGKVIVLKVLKIVYELECDFFKDYSLDEIAIFKKMFHDYYQYSIKFA